MNLSKICSMSKVYLVSFGPLSWFTDNLLSESKVKYLCFCFLAVLQNIFVTLTNCKLKEVLKDYYKLNYIPLDNLHSQSITGLRYFRQWNGSYLTSTMEENDESYVYWFIEGFWIIFIVIKYVYWKSISWIF